MSGTIFLRDKPKISPTPTNDNFQDQNSMVNSQFWGLLRRCFLGAKMVPPLSQAPGCRKKNTQPPISKCNWVTAKAAKVYVSDRLKNHLRCASVRCALKDPSAVPSASPVHYADSTRQVEFFLQLGVFRNGIRATSFIHSAMI